MRIRVMRGVKCDNMSVAKAPSGQTLNGFTCTRSKTSGSLVARMERSVIRAQPIPDYAEFTIGPAEGRTRWLHPGYGDYGDALLNLLLPPPPGRSPSICPFPWRGS